MFVFDFCTANASNALTVMSLRFIRWQFCAIVMYLALQLDLGGSGTYVFLSVWYL